MALSFDLDSIFRPRSVAVVGVSSREQGGGGTRFLAGLIRQGHPHVYPVNPKAERIQGLKAYARLEDIPGPVDHVISCVPAAVVPQLLEEAARKGVRAIHLYTAGFAESGLPERAALQEQIRQRARELGIRLLGPNCLGLYVPSANLAFAPEQPVEAGPAAFISQSGTNANMVSYTASLRGLHFSKVVSFGNAIDIDATELIDYLREDPESAIVGAYLEGMADARPFFAAARRLAAVKPFAILKGGLTAAGGLATQSHTASLAGSGALWQAAAAQINAVMVEDMHEVMDILVGWRFGAVPAGRRIGLVVVGGGVSVQAADDFDREGFALPPLDAETQATLGQFIRLEGTSIRNPVDAPGSREPELLRRTVETVGRARNIDALVVQLGQPHGGHFRSAHGDDDQSVQMIEALAQARAALNGMTVGTIVPTMHDPEAAQTAAALTERAWRAGFPVFYSARAAARAMRRLLTWRERGGVLPELPG